MAYPKLTPVVADGATEPRYVGSRFADMVNVKDYGAKGDGVTDDTAAFQAAAAAGASFVPAGEYNVPDAVDGSFFSFDNVDAGSVDVVNLCAAPRKIKLQEIANSLVGPTQIFCSSDYPEHPGNTYYYQSVCYDTKREVFYLAQANIADESQPGYITTMTDITDPSTVTDHTLSASGHYNDLTYDEKNDLLYAAPGQTGNAEKSLIIINPATKAIVDTWYIGHNVWSCEVKGDWIYIIDNLSNIVRYNTTTKQKDETFSIPVGTILESPNEEATLQSMFFIEDILVCCGTVHVSDMSGQRRCFFKLFDLKTKVSITCSLCVTNNMEMEACTVKDNIVYMMYASVFYLSIGVSPVGLFNASKYYPKKIATNNRYINISKNIEDNTFTINGADIYNAMIDVPFTDLAAGGSLDVRKISSGEHCEQTISLSTGERLRRVGYLGADAYWQPWSQVLSFGRRYTAPSVAISLDDCITPGYFCSINFSDAPAGDMGHVLNLCAHDSRDLTEYRKQIYFRHSDTESVNREIYIRHGKKTNGTLTWTGWARLYTSEGKFDNNVSPSVSNTYSLGQDGYRWSNIYAYTSTIGTSDERLKGNIETPSDALMRAWGKVNFKVFQFNDAIAKKGNEARIHVGVIAQQIQASFASEGLDANKYGLFCYDIWDDEWVDETIVDEGEKLDENGNVVAPEKTHVERKLVREAGDLYSVRYEECLALESAYQRWRLEQLEERVNQLTNNNK